MKCYNFETVDC